MSTGALILGVGFITIFWGHWLAPRWLRKMKERATPENRERYDSFMSRPAVGRLFGAAVPLEGLIMLIGVAYLLTEV
jgi:hypothetical protein